MNSETLHNYIIAFAPMILVSAVFVVKVGESTDQITKSVDDLTEVVEENAKRSIQNAQDLAVLDNRVGYLEGKQ